MAVELRKKFESIWLDGYDELNDKQYQIYAKCRGWLLGIEWKMPYSIMPTPRCTGEHSTTDTVI